MVTFTVITVTCAVLLQLTPYAITWQEEMGGLTFHWPEVAVVAALASSAGTGVGSSEQMAYTYWCVEKGYARFAGPFDDSDDWVRRAKGWIKVMQTDAKLTLVLLTCATIPFYMLGAGVLYRLNQRPNGLETISVLSNMYTETLGPWAFNLFLVGAFFVLFSTVVSGLGASSRVFADGMAAMGLIGTQRLPATSTHSAGVGPVQADGGCICVFPDSESGLDADGRATVQGDQIPADGRWHDLSALPAPRSTDCAGVEGGRAAVVLLPADGGSGGVDSVYEISCVTPFAPVQSTGASTIRRSHTGARYRSLPEDRAPVDL